MYAYGTKLHKRIFVLIMFAILYYSSPFHLDTGHGHLTYINSYNPESGKQWCEGNLTLGDRD